MPFPASLSKNCPTVAVFAIKTGGVFAEERRTDARHEPIIVDSETLVLKDHILWKVEKIMDYAWLHKRLKPYCCHDNGCPGTDPVVFVKTVLIEYGIPSLRQSCREIQANAAYR